MTYTAIFMYYENCHPIAHHITEIEAEDDQEAHDKADKYAEALEHTYSIVHKDKDYWLDLEELDYEDGTPIFLKD